MVHSTWSMWMIFGLPALTWGKQWTVSSSIENLIESQIFHTFNNNWMRLSMMWRSRRSMPSVGYCLHRLPNMITVCRLWGFSGGTDNQKRWYIYIYIYIYIGSRKKLHFHPDKPVSWSLTLQGILMMRIFITIDYILWDYIVGENLNLNV